MKNKKNIFVLHDECCPEFVNIWEFDKSVTEEEVKKSITKGKNRAADDMALDVIDNENHKPEFGSDYEYVADELSKLSGAKEITIDKEVEW